MSQTVHFVATPFLFRAPFRRQALKRSRLRWSPKISDVALSQYAGKRKVLNIFRALIPACVPHQCVNSTSWPLNWTTP